jgi:predicted aspartyl protease
MFGHVARLTAALTSAIAISGVLIAQDNPSSVPIQLTHGKPFVSVMVNGKGPFRFVIDTGTSGDAFVSAELADQLNLPVSGFVHLSDPSKQGSQKVPTVTIQTLRVAGVSFTNVKAVKHALGDADGNCDGLLGFQLFQNYLFTLDYPRRRLTLASGALQPDGEQSVLPFHMPDGIPVVAMRVGDIPIEAQIDSGGTGLSLPERIAPRLKFIADPETRGSAQSMSTRFLLRVAKLASDVRMGSYTFTKPTVEINAAFPLANFGASAMQKFALTFDQKNGLVRFESTQQTLRISAAQTQLKLDLSPSEKPRDISLVPVG